MCAASLAVAPRWCRSQVNTANVSGETKTTPAATEPLAAPLERLIPELMRTADVPGVAIALVRAGRLSWQRGFGVQDRSTRVPVDAATVFEAASVSKTVFAYAAMKLCEDGVIGLDTPLTRYAPEPFLAGDPRLERITARHVLSHSSGFQDWRSRAEPLRIHFTPGESFLYSGEGYFYLQSVISHLVGHTDRQQCGRYEAGLEVCATDIDETLRQRVLAPFGMTSSSYVPDARRAAHAARGHNVEGRPHPLKKPRPSDPARYASAGGLVTTATDYAKFLLEILVPKPADTQRLTRASVAEMLRPQIKLPPDQLIDGASHWALGWAIQQRATGNLILHSGGQSGFRSLTIASVERQSGFILLTNSDNGGHICNDARMLELLGGWLTG
jgi:CubicO group peptidase (beta-lactamase class C family)